MEKQRLGQRHTVQREAILRTIRTARGPLTIAQIHARARRRAPGLGLATVYRAVKLMLEEGRIHCVVMSDGRTRYESADLDHHHHFRCRACRHVYDLPGCPLTIADGTSLPEGFVVESHEVTLLGVCPRCHARRRE